MAVRHGRLVFILGDVHGNFGRLNAFINSRIRLNRKLRALVQEWRGHGDDFDAVILQVGDFAWYWPGCDSAGAIKNRVDFLADGLVKIYWCAGNHEDHDRLDALFPPGAGSPDMAAVDDGVIFCRFGATLDLAPGVTVLFAGGAHSHDIDWRLEEFKKTGVKCWWPQEGISEDDMRRLHSVPRADWVVSHTAPAAFGAVSMVNAGSWREQRPDDEPSARSLDVVLEKYRPKRWYFGHFHKYMKGCAGGCEWTCLAAVGGGEPFAEKMFFEWQGVTPGNLLNSRP